MKVQLTETLLLDNLVREAIKRPSVEQIEKYGTAWVSKYYSKIGKLEVHWQYARRTGDYRIAHYCNRSDADIIHAETNRLDENSPDLCEYLFIPLDTEIKKLRTACGMTQQAFSNYFGIPKRTIEDWEAGRRKPTEWSVKLIEYKLTKEGLI